MVYIVNTKFEEEEEEEEGKNKRLEVQENHQFKGIYQNRPHYFRKFKNVFMCYLTNVQFAIHTWLAYSKTPIIIFIIS